MYAEMRTEGRCNDGHQVYLGFVGMGKGSGMLRNVIGIAVATAFLSGMPALGQMALPPVVRMPPAPGYPPGYFYGPPGVPYGYPGTMPMMPYRPMLPPGMVPVQFNGGSIPPFATDGRADPSLGSGLRTTEPTDQAEVIEEINPEPPTLSDRLPDGLPSMQRRRSPPVMADPYSVYQGVPRGPALMCEPIAVYEGRSYAAERKQDNTCFWLQGNYLYWWISQDTTPPLVTTGNASNLTAGTLGNPDTVVLFGGAIGPREFSGFSVNMGYWLDPERRTAVELGAFMLGRHSHQFTAASNATGLPVLSVPLLIPTESFLGISAPDVSSGSVTVRDTFEMVGAEAGGAQNFLRFAGWSVDGLLAFRYLYIGDNFTMDQNRTKLPDVVGKAVTGGLLFNGAPLATGTNVLISDSFRVANNFFGGQVGARVNWTFRGLDIGVTGKLALGATAHYSTVTGTSSIPTQGLSATGGVFAQSTNIGSRVSTDFSTVYEGTLTTSYQIARGVRVIAGYTYLYWTSVERAGNQIDRNVNLGLPPTSPTFGTNQGSGPEYQNRRSDFWAQGINVGIELRY